MSNITIWDDPAKLQEIKQVLMPKNISETEFAIFLQIGKCADLNPFLKEIWCVKYKQDVPAQIFIGRDGYRKMAQRSPEYDYHYSDAVYSNDKFTIIAGEIHHSYDFTNRGNLVAAYCVCKRKSSSKSVYNLVELKEYSNPDQYGKNTWSLKPTTMIKKVAEAQGLRACFQELFSGTYDEAEDWRKDKKYINYSDSSIIEGDVDNYMSVKAVDNKKYDEHTPQSELDMLVYVNDVPQEKIDSWLKAAKVSNILELTDEQATKCIDWIKNGGKKNA